MFKPVLQRNYATLSQRKIRNLFRYQWQGPFLKLYILAIIHIAKTYRNYMGIRICLRPVTPLSSLIPTSKVFYTGPQGKGKVEYVSWNLEVILK